MILETPNTAVHLSDEERASIASIASSPLRPCPKNVTYVRTLVNSLERGLIGLLRAEWPTAVTGSGYNTILVAPKPIIQRHIEIHTKLQYQPLLGPYLPAVRCEGGLENLGSLLFSWPIAHPQGEGALNAPTLGDLLDKPIKLPRLRNALLGVLNVLNDWRKQATLQEVGIGEFFEGHDVTLNLSLIHI